MGRGVWGMKPERDKGRGDEDGRSGCVSVRAERE